MRRRDAAFFCFILFGPVDASLTGGVEKCDGWKTGRQHNLFFFMVFSCLIGNALSAWSRLVAALTWTLTASRWVGVASGRAGGYCG